ncbi:sensor histidine kinase [Gordonia shandongensis]|uniref:sensor histidine kinase n=1 Tax=Gordonia shandongensis TaxID=376351 RepID=UPI0003FAD7D3|nr:histidine kinase [Gordonia shandongensis]
MDPDDYQPPLTWRGHAWRLIVVLALSVIGVWPRVGPLWSDRPWWLVTDIVLGVVALVVVHWRRSHPVVVTVATYVLGMVSAAASGPATLALVSLSTRRRWREILPVGVFAAVGTGVAQRLYEVPGQPRMTLLEIAVAVVLVALVIAWGMYIGSRRELIGSWRSRAQLAEAEQSAKIREAQVAERSRIAREMHDVLAHRISTIHMYAGALTFRDDLPADQVREAAETIQATSARALTELREVLGVLREGPGDARPEPPQAGAADIVDLVAENRETGMRVTLECETDLAEIPEATGRTLYRCVQEGLTNARKHAPATAVTVAVGGGPDHGVDLVVSNPLPIGARGPSAPPSGFGLVGLAERVELRGGRQSTRVTGDDRFVLRVWLPWQS